MSDVFEKVAVEVERIVHAFDSGDSRRDDVIKLAAKVRALPRPPQATDAGICTSRWTTHGTTYPCQLKRGHSGDHHYSNPKRESAATWPDFCADPTTDELRRAARTLLEHYYYLDGDEEARVLDDEFDDVRVALGKPDGPCPHGLEAITVYVQPAVARAIRASGDPCVSMGVAESELIDSDGRRLGTNNTIELAAESKGPGNLASAAPSTRPSATTPWTNSPRT